MKVKSNVRQCASGVAIAVAMVATAPVYAQAADQSADQARDDGGISEIVVTAQFREQSLQDTPLAITAVSGAMLEARSQQNVAEIAAQAPSVTLKQNNANFGPSLAASIRGVGQYDFSPAKEPGVGMYVDDVYYATLTGSLLDLLDLDRVEILRGPQGTLAGRNSIGGAIKLYSVRPRGDGSGRVSIAYGSRNRLDLRAIADFRLTDTLSMRIAGVSKKQGGYVKRLDFGCVNPQGSDLNPSVGGIPATVSTNDCVVGHDGDVDYQAVRAQLRYQPTADIDINIIADYTNDDRGAAASVLTYANNSLARVRGNYTNVPYDSRFICGQYCNYATYYAPADTANGYKETSNEPESRYEGWGVSGQIDWTLSDNLQLTSITAYREYNSAWTSDDDLSPLALTNPRSTLDFRFFSQEARLNGSFADGKFEYTIGGFYSDQKSVYSTTQDLRWSGLQFQGNDPVPADSLAAFAQASWHLTDRLTLNGGLRYTKESKSYTFSRRTVDGTAVHPSLGALNGVTGTYEGSRVDYRANVQYEWTPDVMTYAQFSTGFKGGGINSRPYFVEQVQPFSPETIDAYEVGFKSELFDRRARLNIAAFYNEYKDIQLTLLSCPQYNPTPPGPGVTGLPCALTANAGDAHIKGLEVEAELHPVDGLTIDGSLSYTDFEYVRIDPAASGSGGVELDYVAPYVSEWQWSGGIQYEIPLGASAGSLTPRFDASYRSQVYANASNADGNLIPGYTLANARLTWRNEDDNLSVSLEVTNLFDKYYLSNIFQVPASGAINAQPGRPREWAVTVNKKF